MENWKPKKLGEICEINPETRNRNWLHNEIEYIDISSVGTGQFIETPKTLLLENAPSRAQRIVRNGDIIVSTVRPNRRSFLYLNKVKPETIASTGFAVLRAKENNDSRFLYYLITNQEFTDYLVSKAEGSAYPAVNPSVFSNADVLVPKYEEQKAIAKILSALDDKIELNRLMNQTLEQMARAVFKAWFVDFEPVRANLENLPSQSASPEIAKLFPSEFENGLPKGWEIGTIAKIVYVQNGYAFKSSDFKEAGTNRVIKIKNISNNQVDVINTQFIDETVVRKIDDKFRISSDDLLIAMTGAEVGKVGLVPKIDFIIWLNQRVGLIRERINHSKWFAYIILSTNENRNVLLGAASGSAQPNISASQIEKTNSLIPTDNLVEKYGELVNSFFEKICENRFENQRLAQIRDSLLPRLISGKIRVGEVAEKM